MKAREAILYLTYSKQLMHFSFYMYYYSSENPTIQPPSLLPARSVGSKAIQAIYIIWLQAAELIFMDQDGAQNSKEHRSHGAASERGEDGDAFMLMVSTDSNPLSVFFQSLSRTTLIKSPSRG